MSIVIPVFNAERYLMKCLDSIFEGYQNDVIEQIEVIAVNDGSTDNSRQYLEEYKHQHSFVLINQSNKGCAGAINTGLRQATGKYVWLVADDDYVIDGALDKILTELTYNPTTDLLQFPVLVDRNGKLKREKACGCPLTNTNGQDAFVEMVYKKQYSAYQFQRIVLREMILQHNIFEKEGLIWDDTEWSPRVFAFAQRVRYFPEPLYTYIRRENSVSHTERLSRKHYTDQLVVISSLNKFMDENNIPDDFRHALYSTLIGPLLNALTGVVREDGSIDEELLAEVRKYEYIMDYGNFKRKYIYRPFIKIFGLKAFCKVRK